MFDVTSSDFKYLIYVSFVYLGIFSVFHVSLRASRILTNHVSRDGEEKKSKRGETMQSPRVRARTLDPRQTVVEGLSSSRESKSSSSLSRPSSVPSCRFLEVRSVCTRLAFLPVHRRAFIGLAFAGSWGYGVLSRARTLHRRHFVPKKREGEVHNPR